MLQADKNVEIFFEEHPWLKKESDKQNIDHIIFIPLQNIRFLKRKNGDLVLQQLVKATVKFKYGASMGLDIINSFITNAVWHDVEVYYE